MRWRVERCRLVIWHFHPLPYSFTCPFSFYFSYYYFTSLPYVVILDVCIFPGVRYFNGEHLQVFSLDG